ESKNILDENDLRLAAYKANLAELYRKQGKYPEAETLYKEALEIRIRSLGSNHPDVANTKNNLALLYYNQGRYSEAETLYKEALEILIKSFGEIHPDFANTMKNLAALYVKQGRYSEAETLYKEALEIYKTLNEKSHLYEREIESIQNLIDWIKRNHEKE
ncbi:MAG: tetratricopeptide repeat protein, partial [Thermoplasmata archaeon]